MTPSTPCSTKQAGGESTVTPSTPCITKQAGGLITRLAAGDNPRIIIEIAIFNAGGVVLPRLFTACDATRQPGGLLLWCDSGVRIFTKMSMYSLLSVSSKCTFLLCGGDSYRYFRRFWPGDSAGRGSGGLVSPKSGVCSS